MLFLCHAMAWDWNFLVARIKFECQNGWKMEKCRVERNQWFAKTITKMSISNTRSFFMKMNLELFILEKILLLSTNIRISTVYFSQTKLVFEDILSWSRQFSFKFHFELINIFYCIWFTFYYEWKKWFWI